MAEGFANHYGGDVLIANSSGLSPVQLVAQETVAIMREVCARFALICRDCALAPRCDSQAHGIGVAGTLLT